MDDIFAIATVVAVTLWVVATIMMFFKLPAPIRVVLAKIISYQGYILALTVITVFRVSLFEMFWIPSSSMQPTLRTGEFVLVDKNDYGVRIPIIDKNVGNRRDPKRGEIIVFKNPKQPSIFFIKRIIALPGDELTIEGNTVSIAGQKLDYLGPTEDSYFYSEGSFGIFEKVAGFNNVRVASEILWEKLPEGWHSILVTDVNIAPVVNLNSKDCETSRDGSLIECIVPPDSYFVMGDNRHRSNDSRFWGFVPRNLVVGPAFAVAISLDTLKRSFSTLGLTEEATEIEGYKPPVSLK